MKSRNPTHIAKALPRMSWSPANLYNLYQRTYGPPTSQTKFTKSSLTLFQQRWIAKRLVRAYHGDWIAEGTFKKAYLPDALPAINGKVPLGTMMFAEVEKRVDTVVFRACLADSVYKARLMVVHGKVKVNGKKHTDPNTRLEPGDLVTVEPTAVVTLQPSPKSPSTSAEATATEEVSIPVSEPEADAEFSAEASAETLPPPPTVKPSAKPLPFNLPPFAAPFLFVPSYLEVSYSTCSIVYLRHPTAREGESEVPSPYEADGEVVKLAWEYYVKMGRRGDSRPAGMVGKRLGA